MENKQSLERIIKNRRSVRNFSDREPTKEAIDRMLESAIYAPIGGVSGDTIVSEVRRLFVFKQGTAAMTQLHEMVHTQIAKNARKMGIMLTLFPFMKKKLGMFHSRLNAMAIGGIPSLGRAPYVIVIAEKKRFPPVGKQSMAYALENMWLTATEQGLGLQLVSAIGTMSDNGDFMDLVGLKKGEWDIEGCAVGYPAQASEEKKEMRIEDFATWK